MFTGSEEMRKALLQVELCRLELVLAMMQESRGSKLLEVAIENLKELLS